MNRFFFPLMFYILFGHLIQSNGMCDCNETHCVQKKIKKIRGVMILDSKREVYIINENYKLYNFNLNTKKLTSSNRRADLIKSMKLRRVEFAFTDSDSHYYASILKYKNDDLFRTIQGFGQVPRVELNDDNYELLFHKISIRADEVEEGIPVFESYNAGREELYGVLIFYPDHIDQFVHYYFLPRKSVYLHRYNGKEYFHGDIEFHRGKYEQDWWGRMYNEATNASKLYPFYIIPLPENQHHGFIFFENCTYSTANIDSSLLLNSNPILAPQEIYVADEKVNRILALIFIDQSNRNLIMIDDKLRNISVTVIGNLASDAKLKFSLNSGKNLHFIESIVRRNAFSVVSDSEMYYFAWQKDKRYHQSNPITDFVKVYLDFGSRMSDLEIQKMPRKEFHSFMSFNVFDSSEAIFSHRTGYAAHRDLAISDKKVFVSCGRLNLIRPYKTHNVYSVDFKFNSKNSVAKVLVNFTQFMSRSDFHPLFSIKYSGKATGYIDNEEHLVFFNTKVKAQYVKEFYKYFYRFPLTIDPDKKMNDLIPICDPSKTTVTTKMDDEYTEDQIASALPITRAQYTIPDYSSTCATLVGHSRYSVVMITFSIFIFTSELFIFAESSESLLLKTHLLNKKILNRSFYLFNKYTSKSFIFRLT